MRVILLRDVAKIGKRFDVCEVPTGHALNFLIPRKLAEPATKEALRKHEVESKKKSIQSERHDTNFKSTLEALMGNPVVLSLPANEQGHLFKGVHAEDVVRALGEKGHVVNESEVKLEHPIKEVGDHTITLKSGDVAGEITLSITRA